MTPVERALWFVESHFGEAIDLDAVAAVAGVSRYHLVRSFAVGTGYPVMRYVRARRLSEAAKALADGAPGILEVALQAGYGSHEAFTRAFRQQFGIAPDCVRAKRALDDIQLVEPIKMDETPLDTLDPPRFADGKAMLIAGLRTRYTQETVAGIPAQWQRFQPYLGNVPGQVGNVAYGVCCNGDDDGNVDYLCGVEVAGFSELPPELDRLRIAAQRYAVFRHAEHISTIRRTWFTIMNAWLPKSGHALADAPEFERYDESFDPATGQGGLEIWIPIKA
jgi:AraC family transcriptional regulator